MAASNATPAANRISVTPLHAHVGAEIGGVDLREPLDDASFAAIEDAFHRYSVLIFRDQDIDDEQQVRFSRRFGELERTDFKKAASHPYVYRIANVDARGQILAADAKQRTFLAVNSRWHTDSSFKPVPSKASLLSGRTIPPTERADTQFASMRAGYRTLPAEKRDALRGLIGVHHYAYSVSRTGDAGLSEAELDALPPARHPLLRHHHGSGEASLFVSGHIAAIDGMAPANGQRLAEELVAWCTRDDYVYSHAWREGDLVMWDNRCTLHRAASIPSREVRIAHRTTVAGDGPVMPAA